MKRGERIAVLVGVFVAGGFAAILVSGAADALGRKSWFGNGANVIQWISGPATFAAVGAAFYAYLVRRCATPWCPRFGEHPVEGTLEKVCSHHHTHEHHLAVFERHGAAHAASDRLDRGQSHRSAA